MHPLKNQILYFDAYAVNVREKLRLFIPVVLLNRDEIYAQPSVLLRHLDEVEIECLPGPPPSTAEADVQNLEVGDALFVKDLGIANEEGIDAIIDLEEAVYTLQESYEGRLPGEDKEDAVDAADIPTVDETGGVDGE